MDDLTTAQVDTLAGTRLFDLQLFADEPPADPTPADPAGDSGTPPTDPTTDPPTDPPADPQGQQTTDPADTKPADLLGDYKPTMPEGFTVNDDIMNNFIPAVRDMGLNPEQADKLVGLGCEVSKAAVDTWVKSLNEQCQKNYTDFIAQQGKTVEADVGNLNAMLTKYGGKDAPEAFQAAMTALSAYGSDAMKPLFTAMVKMGKDFADPQFYFGAAAPETKSIAERLYGK